MKEKTSDLLPAVILCLDVFLGAAAREKIRKKEGGSVVLPTDTKYLMERRLMEAVGRDVTIMPVLTQSTADQCGKRLGAWLERSDIKNALGSLEWDIMEGDSTVNVAKWAITSDDQLAAKLLQGGTVVLFVGDVARAAASIQDLHVLPGRLVFVTSIANAIQQLSNEIQMWRQLTGARGTQDNSAGAFASA